jgi:hypothetical protein
VCGRKDLGTGCEGRTLLNMNDVINIVYFPQIDDDYEEEKHDGDHSWSDDASSMAHVIDLAYDPNNGNLQVVLRYCKLVVTNESLAALTSVGVGLRALTEERECTSSAHAMTVAPILLGWSLWMMAM